MAIDVTGGCPRIRSVWEFYDRLGELFADEVNITGSGFEIGFVRGRDLGGEWGVSLVRKTVEDGSQVKTGGTSCSSFGGAAPVSAGPDTYTTQGISLFGVSAHKFVPFVTILPVSTPPIYNRRVTLDGVPQRLRAFFGANPHGAAAVYLFGSTARGTATPTSDVDVAILLQVDPGRRFDSLPFGLEEELERLLGRTVQIVVLNHAPVDLVHRVLRGGQLVLDRDRSRRIRFEVCARNEFFDLQPVLQRYRRAPAGGDRR